MKLFVAGLLLCMAVAISADEVKYTTKYDGVNLDEILASDRLLGNYLKCLNDEGKCTPDGTELKRMLILFYLLELLLIIVREFYFIFFKRASPVFYIFYYSLNYYLFVLAFFSFLKNLVFI